MRELRCPLCSEITPDDLAETTQVRSNVRKWAHETFKVWRCRKCRSIHQADDPDLVKYYQDYPFSRRTLDGWTRKALKLYFAPLEARGLNSASRILDFGCGSGVVVDYLKERGFHGVVGYDPFSVAYADASVLERPYDFVIAQDVIEHDPDPLALMSKLYRLLRPGGILILGTPRAEGIDLTRLEEGIHSLHAPFHLHIFSEQQMRSSLQKAGFELLELNARHSMDTAVPFLNWNFLKAYFMSRDNTIDVAFDPPNLMSIVLSPSLLTKGLFGYWLPLPKQDMMLIAKRPEPN
jgi:2-polyprenyl-3-methyl-5-hydroxy-6-metoxy-1,4-benzoquinol methylase